MDDFWFVTLGEDEYRLSLDKSTEELSIKIGDEQVDCQVSKVDDTKYSLLIDGKQHVVYVDRRKAKLKMTIGGASVPLTVETELAHRVRNAEAKSGKSKASGETIVAPISGKVVKILVPVGSPCSAGQGVIVLEAMKMENELKAEYGGIVESISVEEGASVETDQELLKIKVA